MGVSKVVYGNDTLVDLTSDTVTPMSLTLGATAHGADGEPIVGEYQYVLPLMSPDTRGGARIQPDSGLEITDTDNLQVRLALESNGTVRGGIAELTAKGHAEQRTTTGKNLLSNNAISQTINGVTFTMNADGSVTMSGTATNDASVNSGYFNITAGTYTLSVDDVVTLNGVTIILYSGTSGRTLVSVHDDITAATFTTNQVESIVIIFRVLNGATVSNFTVYPQLELGSTATEYEPYTGGAPSPSPDYPQEIQVVRGRNLANPSEFETGYVDSDGTIHQSTLYKHTGYIKVDAGKTYVASQDTAFNGGIYLVVYNASKQYVTGFTMNTKTSVVAEIPSNGAYVRSSMNASNENTFQLTLGSTPQPYVPYGHVGMEVRDPDTDELISCTALPLPQRGWVAGLPDGTADTLRLDGAGHVEWTLPVGEVVLDGSSDENWSDSGNTGHAYRNISSGMIRVDGDVNTNVMSDMYRPVFMSDLNGVGTFVNNGIHLYNGTWIIFGDTRASTTSEFKALIAANPITVIFPLAAPVTEDCGYVEDWPTDIPEGATLSIRELDSVGIKYFIDSSVTELAKQWYERAQSEYEDRLQALESAVSDIVTGA